MPNGNKSKKNAEALEQWRALPSAPVEPPFAPDEVLRQWRALPSAPVEPPSVPVEPPSAPVEALRQWRALSSVGDEPPKAAEPELPEAEPKAGVFGKIGGLLWTPLRGAGTVTWRALEIYDVPGALSVWATQRLRTIAKSQWDSGELYDPRVPPEVATTEPLIRGLAQVQRDAIREGRHDDAEKIETELRRIDREALERSQWEHKQNKLAFEDIESRDRLVKTLTEWRRQPGGSYTDIANEFIPPEMGLATTIIGGPIAWAGGRDATVAALGLIGDMTIDPLNVGIANKLPGTLANLAGSGTKHLVNAALSRMPRTHHVSLIIKNKILGAVKNFGAHPELRQQWLKIQDAMDAERVAGQIAAGNIAHATNGAFDILKHDKPLVAAIGGKKPLRELLHQTVVDVVEGDISTKTLKKAVGQTAKEMSYGPWQKIESKAQRTWPVDLSWEVPKWRFNPRTARWQEFTIRGEEKLNVVETVWRPATYRVATPGGKPLTIKFGAGKMDTSMDVMEAAVNTEHSAEAVGELANHLRHSIANGGMLPEQAVEAMGKLHKAADVMRDTMATQHAVRSGFMEIGRLEDYVPRVFRPEVKRVIEKYPGLTGAIGRYTDGASVGRRWMKGYLHSELERLAKAGQFDNWTPKLGEIARTKGLYISDPALLVANYTDDTARLMGAYKLAEMAITPVAAGGAAARVIRGNRKFTIAMADEILKKHPGHMLFTPSRTFLDRAKNLEELDDVTREAIETVSKHGALIDLTKAPANVVQSAKNWYVIPKDLAKTINWNFQQTLQLKELKKWVAGSQYLINLWKGQALTAPAFHARNVLGGNLWNMMAHGFMGKNPIASLREFAHAMRDRRLVFRKGFDVLDPERAATFKMAMEDGIFSLSKHRAEFGKTFRIPGVQRVLEFNRDVGSALEDTCKYAMYRDALFIRGLGREEAAKLAAQSLFKYRDIPRSIGFVRRWIWPFAIWPYKNLPTQLRLLVQNPRYWSRQAKIVGGLADYLDTRELSRQSEEFGVVTHETPDGKLHLRLLDNYLPSSDLDLLSRLDGEMGYSLLPVWKMVGAAFNIKLAKPIRQYYREESGKRYEPWLGAKEMLPIDTPLNRATAELLRSIRITNLIGTHIRVGAGEDAYDAFQKHITYELGLGDAERDKDWFLHGREYVRRMNLVRLQKALKAAKRKQLPEAEKAIRAELQELLKGGM